MLIGIDRFHVNVARMLTGIKSLFAVIGIISNVILLITTVKTRNLRATFHILVAICAVADILHECGTLVTSPFIFDFYIEFDIDTCLLIMFLPEMGVAIDCACILCIGIDRLAALAFSVQYQQINKRSYHLVFASLIAGSCAFLCYLMKVYYRKRKIFCEIVSPYPDRGIVWFVNAVLVMNILAALVYFLLWLSLRHQAGSLMMNRIVKSLIIVATVEVCGWIVTPGLFQFFKYWNFDAQQMFVGSFFSKIFIHIAISIKLYIYYLTSSDYREAINALIYGRSAKTKIIKVTKSREGLSHSFSHHTC